MVPWDRKPKWSTVIESGATVVCDICTQKLDLPLFVRAYEDSIAVSGASDFPQPFEGGSISTRGQTMDVGIPESQVVLRALNLKPMSLNLESRVMRLDLG